MSKIKSMTGFAAAQTTFQEQEISCEIRSVNSRFLEIVIKLPRMIADLENTLKEIIRARITRGKIFVTLNISATEKIPQNLKIDAQTVKSYMNLLVQLKEIAGVDTPITLENLLSFKDVISFEEESSLSPELQSEIERITSDAVNRLNEMRAAEGANLKTDLLAQLGRITRITDEIEALSRGNARVEFDKLYQRLLGLLAEEKIDRTRLEQEVALISDRVDISEETVRMKSHLELFRATLEAGSPIGKKMNFILQEMHRELNTMSSKTTLVEVSHKVVTLKESIEKIREQVQNIE